MCIFYGNKDKSSGIQYSWFPPTLLGTPCLRTPSHENMVFWEAEMKLESLLLFWQSFPQIFFSYALDDSFFLNYKVEYVNIHVEYLNSLDVWVAGHGSL